jgi:predicted phosphodiesterase
MKRLRAFVLCLALLAVLFGCQPDKSYVFAVVGDLQPPEGEGYRPATREIVAQIAGSPAEFVVIVGDLVSGSEPKRWDEFDALVKPIRDANKPIYAVLGNNDAETPEMVSGFLTRFEKRYQMIGKPGLSLVLLDSEAHADGYRDWELGDEQLTWLENKPWRDNLDAGLHPPLFLFLHRPIYRSEVMKADPTGKYGRDKSDLARLFEKLGVDAVFSGHEHLYEKREVEDVTYFIAGGGGGKLLPTASHHFLLVTVYPTKGKWKAKVVKIKGR